MMSHFKACADNCAIGVMTFVSNYMLCYSIASKHMPQVPDVQVRYLPMPESRWEIREDKFH